MYIHIFVSRERRQSHYIVCNKPNHKSLISSQIFRQFNKSDRHRKESKDQKYSISNFLEYTIKDSNTGSFIIIW